MPAEPLQTPSVFTGLVEAAYTLLDKVQSKYVEIGDVTVSISAVEHGNFNVLFLNTKTSRPAIVQYHPKTQTGLDHDLISGRCRYLKTLKVNKMPQVHNAELWRIPETDLLRGVTSVSVFIHTLYTHKAESEGSRSIEDYLHAR